MRQNIMRQHFNMNALQMMGAYAGTALKYLVIGAITLFALGEMVAPSSPQKTPVTPIETGVQAIQTIPVPRL